MPCKNVLLRNAITALCLLNFASGCTDKHAQSSIDFWLTSPTQNIRFEKQAQQLRFGNQSNDFEIITVDTTQTYQTIDGFGYTLTGGSASLIHDLPDNQRSALLEELFSTDSTFIGISYLRISVGASDLSETTYSYNDIAPGQTDLTLANFSIDKEREHLIPLLKEILSINPDIKILGSPWSAPEWMKTNGSFKGGKLKPEYYSVYADYFVKYIKAMETEGIIIDAITPQNEPLHPGNNPSMIMTAEEQTVFIKNNLGPALAAGLNTKILVYDHNCDEPTYPLTILKDKEAYKYVDGSAFHLYAGEITALSQVHDAFPDKNIYFTEQYTSSTGNFAGDLNWHLKNLIIGATRNWSRTVLEWNLAADENQKPHTIGGCTTCLGALTINSTITRNVSYYTIAHASKFVRPGSIRVESNTPDGFPNVAFKTPAGKLVLIVLNEGTTPKNFNIKFNGKMVTGSLIGRAVGTFVW